MFPRLIVLSENAEKVFLNVQEGADFSVGRIADNDLVLPHISISRQHCRISFSDGEFHLKDLESHNGTFLNDEKITEKTLRHGDKIRIGNYELLFLTNGDTDEILPQVSFDEGWLDTKTDFYIVPEKTRFSGNLNVLTSLGKAINESENALELKKKILEIILQTVPAERGAILLFERDFETLKSVTVEAEDKNITVSKTVTQKVMREQIALLSNDLEYLENIQSLVAVMVSSVLCVPLKEGVIYLDTSDPLTKFTENHLQLMTAVSFLVSAALEKFKSISKLENEKLLLQERLEIETNLLGESPPMREVLQLIAKVSKSDSTVLITGESGTGKELAAQTIHQNSPRSDKPFVAVNCAVFNENLSESELFGHERGAFTGAVAQKKGKFELAEGGTIFLDEISEFTPALQAKLLRVLQEREFERVGGTRPIKANVRVIAATNRNLQVEIKNGRFREDLFFRLNVVEVKMPPLRERKMDIEILANHFVRKYAERCHRRIEGISKEARQILKNYNWRGNVRELENIIERAIVIGSTEMILPEDLPSELVENTGSTKTEAPNFHQQVKEAKEKIIISTLENASRNYTDAARLLGIHPNNLHRIIRELGIKEKLN